MSFAEPKCPRTRSTHTLQSAAPTGTFSNLRYRMGTFGIDGSNNPSESNTETADGCT
jgi:hypothetical protein